MLAGAAWRGVCMCGYVKSSGVGARWSLVAGSWVGFPCQRNRHTMKKSTSPGYAPRDAAMSDERFGKLPESEGGKLLMWHHKCRRDVVEFTTREECPVCGKRRENLVPDSR